MERPRRILEKMMELSQMPVKAEERQNQLKWIYPQQIAKLDDISKELEDLEQQLQGMMNETPEAPGT